MYNVKKMNNTNNITNYFDILPIEIIDRIFLFKTLDETYIEWHQQQLFVEILDSEDSRISRHIKQLRKTQSDNYELQITNIMIDDDDDFLTVFTNKSMT